MGNFKKINIYVGAVGQAYVDKETAKNNLDSVKQNIKDWTNIIDLAQSVLDNTNPISNRLTDAQSKANAVKTLLETEMNNAINDTEKYNALKKLRDELHALDYDNDFSNGGNTFTLGQIDTTLDSIVKEINDILSIIRYVNVTHTLSFVTFCRFNHLFRLSIGLYDTNAVVV